MIGLIKIIKDSYQEWLRDVPYEAQQPSIWKGANSHKVYLNF